MNPPRLVAVACLLLVLLAFVGRLLSNPEVEVPGVPALPGTKIALLAAQVPPIRDFDHEFNINHENPFVPVLERREEKKAITEPAVVSKNLPPPSKPVVVEPPRIVWPKARAMDIPRPECLGVISHGRTGRQVLIARLPGGEEQQIERGQRIGEWELIGLTPGGARFRDPKGGEQEVPFVVPTATVMMPRAGADPIDPADAMAPEGKAEGEAGQGGAMAPGGGGQAPAPQGRRDPAKRDDAERRRMRMPRVEPAPKMEMKRVP